MVKLYFARQLGSDDVGALIGRQIEVCRSLLDRLQRGEILGEDSEESFQASGAGNYSRFDFEEDEKRSFATHQTKPSPPKRTRAQPGIEPGRDHFFKLVTELRIKQNQAIIEWLQESRRILSGDYY